MRAHRPTATFPDHLNALYDAFPFERSLAHDPVLLVRPFGSSRRSAEVAGIFAATLAIGNTTAIQGSFRKVLDLAGGDLAAYVDTVDERTWPDAFGPFKHRWIRGDQLGYLALRLRQVYREHGSLEQVFLDGLASQAGFPGGLAALSAALRGPAATHGGAPGAPRGYASLFPSPLESHSPCKRLTLFVRWMVRSGFPDLGVWSRVPASLLRVPLDQHVYWIAYHLGLTRRKSPSWAAVEEVTEALRAVDPEDPVKYDFVLCHTGISGDCPKHREIRVCGACAVRPDCLLWRGRRTT
ncbi:MAG: DUF2400 domain-containing protein [Thermoplasmata archaeon]|nr:DUF2400 domain-containing protein [Thermoplasmata archaeon]